MRKQYDIHRAARPLDRAVHEKYKGVVDFCGGAYGILKGAVQRESATRESGGGELRDAVGKREKAVGEREQAVKEREEALREREKALNARSSEALQSQVIRQCPNHTNICSVCV